MQAKKQGLNLLTQTRLANAERMADRLRQQHALGQAALHVQEDGKSIADLAAKHGYSEYSLRKIRAFARDFSQADVDELCASRRPNGLPLHWGYVPILLAVESKHGVAQRKRFQQRATKHGWTVPELRRAVRVELGFSGHGRTLSLPENTAAAMESLFENLELLLRRCERLAEAARAKRDKRTCAKCRRLSQALTNARRIAAVA
jgi:hypothetical protein